MAFLTQDQVDQIKQKMFEPDSSLLGTEYRGRKNEYYTPSVPNANLDKYLELGYSIEKEGKTKTKVRKRKTESTIFEDQVWCQFYELGFHILNKDNHFVIKWGEGEHEHKQLDIVAIDDKKEIAFVVECKAADKPNTKAPSFKDDIETLGKRMDGVRKSLRQIYGNNLNVRYIFATKNYRFPPESKDIQRLHSMKVFVYNDNTQAYINSLIANYKYSAIYQFYGLVLKGELINKEKIQIPAIRGKMGGYTYYMFSIEPTTLLKTGFVLHRTRSNDSEFPTYQRLLIPKRLKGITNYIDEGGFFPNSIIINFNNSSKHKVHFEHSSRVADSLSCFGTLSIPNAYGLAYIIDGQHRVYGYAGSKYKDKNTIPVVAFDGMEHAKQLEIFMDINENQKAVSASLRIDLTIDLLWDSDKMEDRLKALRASIAKKLSNDVNSPLYNKITVGEDVAELQPKPFTTALSISSLLSRVRGNKLTDDFVKYSMYDTNELNNSKAMEKSQKEIVAFLEYCYSYILDNFQDIFNSKFILSNRGTYAFIGLIGSVHQHLINKGVLDKSSSNEDRQYEITKFVEVLCDYLHNKIKDEEKNYLSEVYGGGADVKWLRFYQQIIHNSISDYCPPELIEWQEMQNNTLQEEGRTYGRNIVKQLRNDVIDHLKELFGEKWELEISPIKRACIDKAEKQKEKYYKEVGDEMDLDWKDVMDVSEFKAIIEKNWSKTNPNITEFKSFEEKYSFDIGEGNHTKAEKTKWLSYLNSYKDLWNSDNKRLTKVEVERLKVIYNLVLKQTSNQIQH